MKNLNDDSMITRCMIALGCNKRNDLASLLNISPQNLSGYIARGTLLNLIEPLLHEKKININWIKTGQGAMINGRDEGTPPAESPHASLQTNSNSSDSSNTKTSDLLVKTAQILESQTLYGLALRNDIEAFHQALMRDAEQQKQNDRIKPLEEEVKELRQRLKLSAVE